VSTVTSAFDEFDESLKLDTNERDDAIELHHEIREVLAEAGVCGNAILQGSFRRKTMLAPLRDIDMVGFLNSEHRDLMTQPGGVDDAMTLIEDALRPRFPDASLERSRHAIKIDFPDRGFTFDLVPAFDREGSEIIDIANYDDDTWDPSNTRELIRVVQERNEACDGLFIHQARMVKHWARITLTDIPGLYVESATFDAIQGPMAHPEAVRQALVSLELGLELGVQNDPTGTDDLFQRLEPGAAEAALPLVRAARQKSDEALELAAAGDAVAAQSVWYSLFGDPYPKPPTQSVEDAFTNSLTGGLTTTGVATATSAARVSTPPVRPWRPR
jgi:hypothetical protein